jgi:hypothetical protein
MYTRVACILNNPSVPFIKLGKATQATIDRIMQRNARWLLRPTALWCTLYYAFLPAVGYVFFN